MFIRYTNTLTCVDLIGTYTYIVRIISSSKRTAVFMLSKLHRLFWNLLRRCVLVLGTFYCSLHFWDQLDHQFYFCVRQSSPFNRRNSTFNILSVGIIAIRADVAFRKRNASFWTESCIIFKDCMLGFCMNVVWIRILI